MWVNNVDTDKGSLIRICTVNEHIQLFLAHISSPSIHHAISNVNTEYGDVAMACHLLCSLAIFFYLYLLNVLFCYIDSWTDARYF